MPTVHQPRGVRRSQWKERLFLDLAKRGVIVAYQNGIVTYKDHLIPTHGNGRGYVLARVSHQGKRYSIMFHCLVWACYFGPIPSGMEINHRNGVKTDNRLANLELTTRTGNLQHAIDVGLRDQVAINKRWHAERRARERAKRLASEQATLF